jgi:hypothetical protein
VHRFSRAARDAVRAVEMQNEGQRGRITYSDSDYNEALEQILGEDYRGEIWLPHK